MVVGPRARIHLARQHFILRRLPRGLVDQRHIESLLLKVSELLGEHVRQINLLAQPAYHDLNLCRSAAAAATATASVAAAASTKQKNEDDAEIGRASCREREEDA